MGDIYCYSWVEDAPSAAVIRKLVETRNASARDKLLFLEGFPAVTRGCSALRSKCPSFLDMAKGGLYTVALADLDVEACAAELIRNWFAIPAEQPVALPERVVFRVAVREIEAWILADHGAWAQYIGIAPGNFTDKPDLLSDPKRHLLSVIRRKGRKRCHREMLPSGTAHIGPLYNDVLCQFVQDHWVPGRAAGHSPSLKRAMTAVNRIQNG